MASSHFSALTPLRLASTMRQWPGHTIDILLLCTLYCSPPSKVRAAAAALNKAAGLASPNHAEQQQQQRQHSTAAAADPEAQQQVDAASAALQALLAAIGAGSVQAAVTKHRGMEKRLERLDQARDIVR